MKIPDLLTRKKLLAFIVTAIMICGMAPGVFAEGEAAAEQTAGEAVLMDETQSAQETDVVATAENNSEQADLENDQTNGTQSNATGSDSNSSTNPVTLELSGTKKLEGRELKNKEFSFQLEEINDEDGTSKTLNKALNDAEGRFKFTVYFYGAGKRHFRIREVASTDSTVTYDNNMYEFTVDVEKDASGQWKTTAKDMSSTVITTNAFNFTNKVTENTSNNNNTNDSNTPGNSNNSNTGSNNTSGNTTGTTDSNNNTNGSNTNSTANTSDPSSYTFKGKLSLTGKTLKKDDFTITLKETTSWRDKDDLETQTTKNDASGNFSFDPIKYTKEGEYTYEITQKSSDTGITSDSTVFKATIKVEKDANGTLIPKLTSLTNAKGTNLLGKGIEFLNSLKGSGSDSSNNNTTTTNTTTNNTTTNNTTTAKSPATGDSSGIALYAVLLAGFVIVLAGTVFSLRRKKSRK